MLTVLNWIWQGVKSIGHLVLWALVSAINLLIEAIGAFISLLVLLLPEMPTPPNPPSSGILQWLAWLFPLGGLVTGLLVWVGIWLAYLVIRIPLRWMRVL